MAALRYYIVNRQTRAELAGPLTRFVDAFNARATFGAIGMIVEREETADCAGSSRTTTESATGIMVR